MRSSKPATQKEHQNLVTVNTTKDPNLKRTVPQTLAFPSSSCQGTAPILSSSDNVDYPFSVLVPALLHLTLTDHIPIVHLFKGIPQATIPLRSEVSQKPRYPRNQLIFRLF